MFSAFAKADSVLAHLPFGIKIGVTKNSEIESKGKCRSKIKVTDSYYRCESYNMLEGKFYTYSSQGEIVNKVLFNLADDNSLPQAWQDIGIQFSTNWGSPIKTNTNQFLQIIKSNGASNIDVGPTSDGSTISFDISDYHFDVKISDQYGLWLIAVTESY
jgi:hypothetical protein